VLAALQRPLFPNVVTENAWYLVERGATDTVVQNLYLEDDTQCH